MGFYKDLTGQQFGYLTVVEHVGNSQRGVSQWKCRCHCGVEKTVGHTYLTHGKVRSCGCMRWAHLARGIGLYTDKQQAQKNKAYRDLINNAEARKLSVELSYDEWLTIVVQPCFYCRRKNSNTYKQSFKYNRSKLLGETFRANGVDRLDSRKGYILDNCVPCCKICNRAKSDMDPETFINWTISVAQNFYLPKVKEVCE